MENHTLIDENLPAGRSVRGNSPPASWKDSLLALGPFVYFPIVNLVSLVIFQVYQQPDFPDYLLPVFAVTMVLVPVLGFIAVIGISVARRFPRWTMPYWGLLSVCLLYLMTFSGTIAGQNFDGSWWVWLPLLLAVLVGLLAGKWLRGRAVDWKLPDFDWTSVSFIIYGIIPAYLFASFDEVHDSQVMVTSSMLLLAGGAWFYMRSAKPWQRLLSLVAGVVLGWGLASINLANYWGGRQEAWMSQAGDWWGTLLPMLAAGGVLIGLLLAPWLVSRARNLLSGWAASSTAA